MNRTFLHFLWTAVATVLIVSPVGAEVLRFGDYHPHEPRVNQEEAELLQQVQELMGEDRNAEAIALLQARINAESSPALEFALGTVWYAQEQTEAAEQAFRDALAKMPSFSRARANLATLLIQQDREDEALEELRTVMLEGSPDAQVLTMTGYIYLLKGEPVPAEVAYRQAIVQNPQDTNAYLGLAKSLLLQERHDEVIHLVQSMLEKDAAQAQLWTLLGNAYVAQHEPMQAISAMEAARRLQLLPANALSTLGDLYLNQRLPQQAAAAYEESFALQEPSLRQLIRTAHAFLMLQKPEQAPPFLQSAMDRMDAEQDEVGPAEREEIYWLNSRQAQLSGRSEEARSGYEKVLEINPLHGEALMALGDWHRDAGELEKALMMYERASRIESRETEGLVKQAQVYVERGEYAQAVELLEQAQVLNPKPYVGRYLAQVRRLSR